ncbi:CHAT domain-containing protein [Nucisporomicrobium flavum]|uniref:CHAT domain-containing protein n=1 Tax=Nucisporomicrobium flavum TaxID=2785915 RepID=UPI003C2C7433
MRLILRVEPVHRVAPVSAPPGPGVHVVYATGTGELFSLGGRALTSSEQVSTRYRMRYDVDTADHRIVLRLEGEPYPVEVGFRVHDPLAVVRNAVEDPEPIIGAVLALRGIDRGFRDEIRLPEGITVFSVEPQLPPAQHGRAEVWEQWEQEVVEARIGNVPGGAVRSSPPSGDLERFLIGELPTSVRVGQEFSLVARIAVDKPWPGASAAPLVGFPTGPDEVEVVLLVQPRSGLRGEDLQATVRVPADGGSAPVRFGLRAHEVGLLRLELSAWIGGTALAELTLEISAEPAAVDERTQHRRAPMSELASRPGDVTLQVSFDGSRYSFQIASSRYWSEQIVARSLTEAPGQAVERTVDMLRRFAGGQAAYGPAAARRWVQETGVGLWRDMVPDAIKDAFWELRGQIGTFTIACADDSVPWELLYPLDRAEDHGFLVEQFPVLRRVFGTLSAQTVSVDHARYIVPGRSPANAREEAAAVHRILAGGAEPAYVTHLDDLMAVLDGPDVGLLHFACHNAFSLQQGGSAIAMEGGAFVPLMLNSAVQRRRFADRHPLVFVNACRSAGVAPEYTRMMGWASQFMLAGAGAFVGTLWPVGSARAAGFAEAFYAELTAGAGLGTASLRARQAIADPGDPTWLAYTAYGDPTATISRAV